MVLAGTLCFVGFEEKLSCSVLVKKSILKFWQKIFYCGISEKFNFFLVLIENWVFFLEGKTYFCDFVGKLNFAIITGNLYLWSKRKASLLQFWWENSILWFWRKKNSFVWVLVGKLNFVIFTIKPQFMVLMDNFKFTVLMENFDFPV